jgi:hypothetical protein
MFEMLFVWSDHQDTMPGQEELSDARTIPTVDHMVFAS